MQRKAHGNRDERAASEVFGCIPHGARAFLNEVEKVGGGGHWTQSILLLVRLAAC